MTGRPLASLPQLSGRGDSEIFFEALVLNDIPAGDSEVADAELLARYFWELEAAFGLRQDQLTETGRLLPGARQAVAATGSMPGVVQAPLTGAIRPNSIVKLQAFGLAEYFDLDLGGYGSDAYPRGSLVLMSRNMAAEKFGVQFAAESVVYVADTRRDVEAARVGGAASIAVATGRDTAAELRDAGADIVLADLSDTDAVTAAIDRLTRVPAGR